MSDAIIRATNNQTDVELASLHATDKIQRDIEEVLFRSDLYYERRKNFYTNLGHPNSEIFTPLYLASGFVSLILKAPFKASKLRAKFMQIPSSYNQIFSAKTPLDVWPKIAIILKKTDRFLEKIRSTKRSTQTNFVKNWRQITCLITLSRIMKTYDFDAQGLAHFDINKYTDHEIETTWSFLNKTKKGGGKIKNKQVIRLCRTAANEFNISGFKRIDSQFAWIEDKSKPAIVDPEFSMKVNSLLPAQPWKPGIHLKIMEKLKCTYKEYSGAVKYLITEGVRNKQKDGIVYDTEGNVLCFDPERVNSDSMEILNDEDQ